MAAANRNQESLVRVLQNADTILSRISNRSGTLGLLVADSSLYRETTLTMIQLRQLLSDIQANPRKGTGNRASHPLTRRPARSARKRDSTSSCCTVPSR